MRSQKIIFHRNSQFAKCPSCKSHGSLRKSKSRGPFEQFVKRFTFFRIYRCRECGWRGYKSNYTLTSVSFKNIAVYLMWAILVAFIVRFILLKFII